MKRLIYSIYIEVPDSEFVDNQKTNLNTKKELKENYQRLIDCKQQYADSIGADFVLINKYEEYKDEMKSKYPFLTTYNIINFYKIFLLYKFSSKYDQMLYLDFDVIPNTKENFFEVFDLSKGIAIANNNDKVSKIDNITETSQTIRSPNSKYYNSQAMLLQRGLSSECDVVNTGIIGIDKSHLYKLEYFNQFDQDMITMTQLKFDKSMFPKKIVDYFGYDNETLFSVKLKQHNVPVQWLDDDWHYFFYDNLFIPESAKLIHAINKKFDIVWRNVNA
ncbi:MAG: hypothetical protein CBD57_03195 [Candidatus Pelagibacter sp. TMED197]|jgi:hypothetical protein|nr:MAG: hypothetical protein CBD57_03195 [Candidatus Pelagibacter sp. TMED197]|tara:strand:+ start:566 stop:1393 length:828 start_codon:yes stop_codon:yes gene_type:complete